MGHPIFHLELIVRSCAAELHLNGFPVIPSLVSTDEVPVSFAPPVNPYLAGSRNTVELTLRAAVAADGSEVPFEAADFEMNVRRFEKGDIFEPGAGEMVTRFRLSDRDELQKRIRKGEQKPPVTVSHPFINEVLDFSAELLDAPPFEDAEAVVDYALHLRNLMAARDVEGLLAEYEPKAHVWVRAYAKAYQHLANNTRKGLEKFIGSSPRLDFDRDDLLVRPYCGGRIWGLHQRNDVMFTRNNRGWIALFVALREGTLRVVR
jgi:hypothetical protein